MSEEAPGASQCALDARRRVPFDARERLRGASQEQRAECTGSMKSKERDMQDQETRDRVERAAPSAAEASDAAVDASMRVRAEDPRRHRRIRREEELKGGETQCRACMRRGTSSGRDQVRREREQREWSATGEEEQQAAREGEHGSTGDGRKRRRSR